MPVVPSFRAMGPTPLFLALAAMVIPACGTNDRSAPGADGGGDAATTQDGTVGDDVPTGSDDGSAVTGPDAGGSETGSDAGATDASASEGGGSQDAAVAYEPSVYQHHKNGTRNGLYIDPVLTAGHVATTHVVTGFTGSVATDFMGTTSTNIYAQPLYVVNGPGGNAAFVVATELNHVTTYNATTGAVLWDKGPSTYGNPVGSGLPCGSITPLGITGTPFIDYSSGTGVIYFDAMTNVMTDSGQVAKHMVWAVNVEDGSALPNWPVDVSATVESFTSNYQNQRGALQLVNGILYVPYGGLNGDCLDSMHPYYGWVVGFPLKNPQHPTGWHTSAPKGGIWGPGSLPTDGTSVFPVTGNTAANGNTWGGGEAVIRLGAGPTFSNATADYYAPTNWKSLDNSDSDLGGASEVLFDMPGTSKPHLVGVGGKDSNFYILNRDNLGGIGPMAGPGTELFKGAFATNEFKGAPAAYTTSKGTYVAFHVEGGTGAGCASPTKGNLVAVRVTAGAGGANPTAAVAWCSVENGLGSPMVTTTDGTGTSSAVVWDANDHLWAYDGDTGMKLFAGSAKTQMTTAIDGWNTPIAIGGGRIAVLVNGQLYVFTAP